MACHPRGDGVFVYGGYCKVKDTANAAQGKMLQDAWWLNMQKVNSSITSKIASENVWEKLGKKASLSSIRSGMHPKGLNCIALRSFLCHSQVAGYLLWWGL